MSKVNGSKRLCLADRLLHNNSKVRYAANVDLKLLCDSVTHPKDHRIRKLGRLFKKTVSDPDAHVQDKALDALIAYLKAADADVAKRYAKEVIDAITAKCLMGPPKTVEKARIVFMLWLELEAVDTFMDAMEKTIKSQDAKAVVLAIDFTIQALSEFGPVIVPLDRIANMLMEILDHQDQNVLDSSKGLALELSRWVTIEPIKVVFYKKMSDKMKEELDLELSTVKASVDAPRKIRSAPKGPLFLGLFPYEESPAETPLGKDNYKPDDILSPLKKSGFWNKVKSRRWTQRKEAVSKLIELASTKRIVPGDFTNLCPTLEKLITDRRFIVRVEAVRAIGNLALQSRVDFSRCSLILLPALLAKFSEKRPILTEELTNTLKAIHKAGCVTLANILTDVNTAVKSEDPHVCSGTLNWVMHCIDSSNELFILNVHKDYIRICLECLNDGTAQVQDAAISVLAAIEKLVGTEPLNMSFKRRNNFRRKKFSDTIGYPTVALMKHGLKRGRIVQANMARGMKAHGLGQNKLLEHKDVEPCEMTQLKNSAWNKSLEEIDQLQKMSLSDSQEQNKEDIDSEDEINQLQKMSLSDPQEQNKKDFDCEDGHNKFQESEPAWFADDFYERLSLDELMALRPEDEYCARCGLLDNGYCSCKRRARIENVDLEECYEAMYGCSDFYGPPAHMVL